MGTEGTRRRNRNRRLRKKRLRRSTKVRLISPELRGWIRLYSMLGFLMFAFIFGQVEAVWLYKNGVTTEAIVYKHRRLRHGVYNMYEYRVSGKRYTQGEKGDSLKVGHIIEVKYLPNHPWICLPAEEVDIQPLVKLYRKTSNK